jgi:hypothetical protein
MRKKS